MKQLASRFYSVFVHWLTLMILFSVGRFLFIMDFFPADFFQDGKLSETIKVFFLAMRFDSSISTLFIIFPVIFAYLSLLFPKKLNHRIEHYLITPFVYFSLIFSSLLSVILHYYYFYYKDKFNVFFWEFWFNLENAKLVVWSAFDELPMKKMGVHLTLLLILVFLLHSTLKKSFVKKEKLYSSFFSNKWLILSLPLFLFLGIRATFDLPLVKQEARGRVSKEQILNMIHVNPVFEVYVSYENFFDIYKDNGFSQNILNEARRELAHKDLQLSYDMLYGMSSAHEKRIIKGEKAQITLPYYTVPSLGDKFLKKKPKHIVLIFSESYAKFVPELESDGFGKSVAPFYHELKSKSLFFNQYFAAGSGTMSNLMKGILQIPTPVNFAPEIAISDAFKPFPTATPRLLKSLGYKPSIYYGGSLFWHNFGYLAEKAGFDGVYGEQHIPAKEYVRFGVLDEDLFQFVHEQLKKSEGPSFHYVMTLSNHPPYRLPKDFKLPFELKVPSALKNYMVDEENFHGRYSMFHYADYATRRFFEMAKREKYYDDTLFIFTADHPQDGPFNFPTEDVYKFRQIPLMIYASPALLAAEPKEYSARGTHLDLVPTLLSLVQRKDDKTLQAPLWGMSLLDDDIKNQVYLEKRPLFNYSFNCIEDDCIHSFQHFKIDRNKMTLKKCDDILCESRTNHIKTMRKAWDDLGVNYFLNF